MKELSVGLNTELTNIMMEAMQLMFEDVKTELTEYINKTFSQRIDQGLVYHIFFHLPFIIIYNFDIKKA